MLEVTSGFSLGAIVLLDRRRSFIGRSPSADLMLHDAGVASKHAAIVVDNRRIRLEAIGADIDLPTRRLRMGDTCNLETPVDLVLGGATVRVLQPNWIQPGARQAAAAMLQVFSQRVGTTTGIGIVAAIALSLVGGAMALSMRTTKLVANDAAPVELAETVAAGVSIVAKDNTGEPGRVRRVARDLTADLDAAGAETFNTTWVDRRSLLTAHAQLDVQLSDRDSGDPRPRTPAGIQYTPTRYDPAGVPPQLGRHVRPNQWRSRRDADCGRSSGRPTDYPAYPCRQGNETAGPDRGDRRPQTIRTGMDSFWRSRLSPRQYSSDEVTQSSRFDVSPLTVVQEVLPAISSRLAPPPTGLE